MSMTYFDIHQRISLCVVHTAPSLGAAVNIVKKIFWLLVNPSQFILNNTRLVLNTHWVILNEYALQCKIYIWYNPFENSLLSHEFTIVQHTGNASYISSVIYSTYARSEHPRRVGRCKKKCKRLTILPISKYSYFFFLSFILVQIFSNWYIPIFDGLVSYDGCFGGTGMG